MDQKETRNLLVSSSSWMGSILQQQLHLYVLLTNCDNDIRMKCNIITGRVDQIPLVHLFNDSNSLQEIFDCEPIDFYHEYVVLTIFGQRDEIVKDTIYGVRTSPPEPSMLEMH